LSYIISALLAKPDWTQVAGSFLKPSIQFDPSYLTMILGIVGTTIAPWMQFYMQSALIEKGLKPEDYKFVLWDVIIALPGYGGGGFFYYCRLRGHAA